MLSNLPGWIMRPLFGLIARFEWLSRWVNRLLIDRAVKIARSRPHPWSTVHDYVSWTSLSDRTWSARHLPAVYPDGLPDPERLIELFRRPDGSQRMCPKSTCLFPTFAQYLTDGFIRTEMADDVNDLDSLKRNTSNHQIDLCTLYGRTAEQTRALRLLSEDRGRRGRLKSQMLGEEEFPPFLFAGDQIDPAFKVLDPPLGLSGLMDDAGAPKRAALFAVGGDRVNSVPQVAMLNTLLLREHNRLAGELEQRNPDWDDTRVFETARNIVIVLFIKLVVEEYINHIAPTPFFFRADPKAAWHAVWNKPNWITTEFSLLYRWHSLIPDTMTWNGVEYPVGATFMDNRPVIDGGLRQGFYDMSAQRAAELGAFNTADPLLPVEAKSILQGRHCALAPYARYRTYASMQAPARFTDISSDQRVVDFLRDAYGTPEKVDFYIGLFAEDRVKNAPLPPLILRMVAVDAFSQALTNPLLSEHVFSKDTFSPYGWATINETANLRDMVARNTPGGSVDGFIGMTRPGWQHQW